MNGLSKDDCTVVDSLFYFVKGLLFTRFKFSLLYHRCQGLQTKNGACQFMTYIIVKLLRDSVSFRKLRHAENLLLKGKKFSIQILSFVATPPFQIVLFFIIISFFFSNSKNTS